MSLAILCTNQINTHTVQLHFYFAIFVQYYFYMFSLFRNQPRRHFYLQNRPNRNFQFQILITCSLFAENFPNFAYSYHKYNPHN